MRDDELIAILKFAAALCGLGGLIYGIGLLLALPAVEWVGGILIASVLGALLLAAIRR